MQRRCVVSISSGFRRCSRGLLSWRSFSNERFLGGLLGSGGFPSPLEVEERRRRRVERHLKESELPREKTLATLTRTRLPTKVWQASLKTQRRRFSWQTASCATRPV
jgi:hypothetical protein